MHAESQLFPKSTAKLRVGDYWAVQRSDGDFGFIVFLSHWHTFRSVFNAGLLDIVLPEPHLSDTGPILNVARVGRLHVKTFRETSTNVLGNVQTR